MNPPSLLRASHRLPVVLVALAVGGVAALIGAIPANATSKPTHRTPGFALTDRGLVTPLGKASSILGDLAVDPKGGEHVLTARLHTGKKYAEYRYYSRTASQKRFSSHVVALSIARPLARVSLLTNTSGSKVIAVVSNTHGVWTAQTSIKSKQLPSPRLAAKCSPLACRSEVPFGVTGAVALPHDKVAILALVGGVKPQIFTGTPGKRFTLSNQSSQLDDDLSPSDFLRDPVTGEEYMVGELVGMPDEVQVSARKPGGAWSAPQTIASLSIGGTRYRIKGASASSGHVAVALAQTNDPASPSEPPIEIVQRTPAGTWRAPTRPAHLTRHDLEPQLVWSTNGKRLVLAFDRRTGTEPAPGTVRTEHLHGGTWSSLRTLTSHTTYQTITSLRLGKHDHPIVAFERYAKGTMIAD